MLDRADFQFLHVFGGPHGGGGGGGVGGGHGEGGDTVRKPSLGRCGCNHEHPQNDLQMSEKGKAQRRRTDQYTVRITHAVP